MRSPCLERVSRLPRVIRQGLWSTTSFAVSNRNPRRDKPRQGKRTARPPHHWNPVAASPDLQVRTTPAERACAEGTGAVPPFEWLQTPTSTPPTFRDPVAKPSPNSNWPCANGWLSSPYGAQLPGSAKHPVTVEKWKAERSKWYEGPGFHDLRRVNAHGARGRGRRRQDGGGQGHCSAGALGRAVPRRGMPTPRGGGGQGTRRDGAKSGGGGGGWPQERLRCRLTWVGAEGLEPPTSAL